MAVESLSLRRILSAVCITLLAYSPCLAATGEAEANGPIGPYPADVPVPDQMTTITDQPGVSLVAEWAEWSADRYDPDQYQIEYTINGATVTFTGRSSNWGCLYTVHGRWASGGGGSGESSEWTSRFQEDEVNGQPRIVLEINGEGYSDDFIEKCGGPETKLNVTILGGLGTSSYTVSLSDTPEGSPGGDVGFSSSSVTISGNGGSAQVTLSGLTEGDVQIEGTASGAASGIISAHVVCSCTPESYACDSDGDDIPDTCYQCDLDGDGIPDTCYSADCDFDGIPETCSAEFNPG